MPGARNISSVILLPPACQAQIVTPTNATKPIPKNAAAIYSTPPIEVKWIEHPRPADAWHLISFIKDKLKAKRGFVVCRCARPRLLAGCSRISRCTRNILIGSVRTRAIRGAPPARSDSPGELDKHSAQARCAFGKDARSSSGRRCQP